MGKTILGIAGTVIMGMIVASCAVKGNPPPAPPEARFAYVTADTEILATLSVDGDGTLSSLGDEILIGDPYPTFPVRHPTIRALYVPTVHNGIMQYAIGADGELAALSPASVGLGEARDLDFYRSGPYAYGLTVPGRVRRFDLDTASGALSNPGDFIPTGSDYARTMALESNGGYVFLGREGRITRFSLDPATGALGDETSIPVVAGCIVYELRIHPSGAYLYACIVSESSPGAWDVYEFRQYAIETDGSLEPLSPVLVSGSAFQMRAMAFDPEGHDLYAFGYGSGAPIVHYAVAADGRLSLGASIVAEANGIEYTPWHIAIDPTDTRAYATVQDNATDDGVFQFQIDANGDLSALPEPFLPSPSREARGIVLSQ